MILVIIYLLVGTVLLGLIAGLAYRRFRQIQLQKQLKITAPGGICEEGYVFIGGISQWISVRGEDRNNPIIVVLHGGPGQPYSMFAPLLKPWEEYFTLVQWDQRGAGKTFIRNGKRGSGEISLEQLRKDALEVINYARDKLQKDRVILLASSAGTLISIPLLQEHPELFSAYVGTDQNVNMDKGNLYGYELTLERLRRSDTKKAKQLEIIGNDASRWTSAVYTKKQQLVMNTDQYMKVILKKYLLPFTFFSPGLSLLEAVKVFMGFQFSQEKLLSQILTYDVTQFGPKFTVPFFILQGEHDILSPEPMAKEYFNTVEAPKKAFIDIKDAGHFAMLVQPKQFLERLLQIIPR